MVQIDIPGVSSAVRGRNMPEDKGDGETAEFKERLELDEFKRIDYTSSVN